MARSSTSLVAFLVGAALGGRLAVAMAATSRRRWLLTVALSEALLLVAAAIASIGFDIGSATPPSRLYGRRARRHGRLRRRPDATTGAGLGTTRRSGRTPTKVG